MKTYILICLFSVLQLNNLLSFPIVEPEEGVSNYVVIGAFSQYRNAVTFTEQAMASNRPAKFELNPLRNLFYVYVLQTEDKEMAMAEAARLRADSPYWDTWVFYGYLGDTLPVNEGIVNNSSTSGLNQPVESSIQEMDNEMLVTGEAGIPGQQENEMGQTEEQIQEGDEAEIPDDGSKVFVFDVFNTTNNKVINADVDLINLENDRKVSTYLGNQEARIQPVNDSGNVSVVVELLGYRKFQLDFDFDNPDQIDEIEMDENGRYVVPVGLVRLQKGDISVMYNVFFFNDAAIMRPESRYELNNLMDMMTENLEYEIMLHGHTNGKGGGKIITMGDDQNFFSLTGSNDGFGSAKKLSKMRANVILDYMVAEGISTDRISVKAWGGKRPIYDKSHPQAQENVRVEVEIVAD